MIGNKRNKYAAECNNYAKPPPFLICHRVDVSEQQNLQKRSLCSVFCLLFLFSIITSCYTLPYICIPDLEQKIKVFQNIGDVICTYLIQLKFCQLHTYACTVNGQT